VQALTPSQQVYYFVHVLGRVKKLAVKQHA